MKNPLTPAGIEPATFRFVAQHLNHCATVVPTGIQYNALLYTTAYISYMCVSLQSVFVSTTKQTP